jgi:hypothetical protein
VHAQPALALPVTVTVQVGLWLFSRMGEFLAGAAAQDAQTAKAVVGALANCLGDAGAAGFASTCPKCVCGKCWAWRVYVRLGNGAMRPLSVSVAGF